MQAQHERAAGWTRLVQGETDPVRLDLAPPNAAFGQLTFEVTMS
jgi:hypothetical protein